MLPNTHPRTEKTSVTSEFQPPRPICLAPKPGAIISQGCRRVGFLFLMLKPPSSRLNELLRYHTFPHTTPYPHSSAPVFHAGFFRHSHCLSPNLSPRFHSSTKDRTTATQPRKLKNFAPPQPMLPNTHLRTENTSVRSEFQPRRAIFGTQRLVRSSFNDEDEWNYC
jgi:hypothetical protein